MSNTARPPATLAPCTRPDSSGSLGRGPDGGFVVRSPPPGAGADFVGRGFSGTEGAVFVGDGVGSGCCGDGDPGPVVGVSPSAMGSERGGSYSVLASTV
ncbi:hypothetical protein [Streptomyces sp. HNM0575]|uniref:hypothetical protein n=1 Tax=Streptomyces sp. HNM0575 TaxID=2716338 RepID=UPI003216B916